MCLLISNDSFFLFNVSHFLLVDVSKLEDAYILKVNMDRLVKTWWMLIAVPASLDLGQLDRFFRGVWMECGCGHLSMFNYSRRCGSDLKFHKKLNELQLEKKLVYSYDFGGTERVLIEHLGTLNHGIKSNFAVVLSRNSIPKGYPYTVNTPRAMEGHGIAAEVTEMKMTFDLPPGSGDESSRNFAEKNPYNFDSEDERELLFGKRKANDGGDVDSSRDIESSFLTDDGDDDGNYEREEDDEPSTRKRARVSSNPDDILERLLFP